MISSKPHPHVSRAPIRLTVESTNVRKCKIDLNPTMITLVLLFSWSRFVSNCFVVLSKKSLHGYLVRKCRYGSCHSALAELDRTDKESTSLRAKHR